MADFSPSALAAAAGVDPWLLARRLTSGEPASIEDTALHFRRAAMLAAELADAGQDADLATATAFRNDGAAVFDAPASIARGVRLLAERGDTLEETARVLLDVAAGLAEHAGGAAARISALDADLQRIIALRDAAVAGYAGSTAPGAAAAALAIEQHYHRMAVDVVSAAGNRISAEIDAYSALLDNRAGRLTALGHPAEIDETDGSGGIAAVLADVGDTLAGLGDAALHDPEAVLGLLTGAGLILAGAAAVGGGGGVTVGTGGAAAVAGVPAAAAGAAAIGTGFGIMIAAANRLADGAGGRRREPSINQAQKEVERGNAPKSIDRFDRGRVEHEQPHVHFKDGNALNKDGTWKHGPGRELSAKEKDFLEEYGWQLPK